MTQTSHTEIHTQISTEEIARTFDEVEAPIDISGHGIEDWVTLVIFWVMCGCVFLQFFTRYVLNNSFAWTEEIAIYCLVAVVFLGSVMCVRLSRHIHVNFFYRVVSPQVGRKLSLVVDLIRISVFSTASSDSSEVIAIPASNSAFSFSSSSIGVIQPVRGTRVSPRRPAARFLGHRIPEIPRPRADALNNPALFDRAAHRGQAVRNP